MAAAFLTGYTAELSAEVEKANVRTSVIKDGFEATLRQAEELRSSLRSAERALAESKRVNEEQAARLAASQATVRGLQADIESNGPYRQTLTAYECAKSLADSLEIRCAELREKALTEEKYWKSRTQAAEAALAAMTKERKTMDVLLSEANADNSKVRHERDAALARIEASRPLWKEVQELLECKINLINTPLHQAWLKLDKALGEPNLDAALPPARKED